VNYKKLKVNKDIIFVYVKVIMTSKIIVDYKDIMKDYNPRNNITRNILSKYEKTKIIGLRMEQLVRNSPPCIEIDKTKPFNPFEIAMKELESRKIPFMIARKLPNGKKEYWRIEDLIIP
jgi:DNA-directed RNA polymerase subunit K/omega